MLAQFALAQHFKCISIKGKVFYCQWHSSLFKSREYDRELKRSGFICLFFRSVRVFFCFVWLFFLGGLVGLLCCSFFYFFFLDHFCFFSLFSLFLFNFIGLLLYLFMYLFIAILLVCLPHIIILSQIQKIFGEV